MTTGQKANRKAGPFRLARGAGCWSDLTPAIEARQLRRSQPALEEAQYLAASNKLKPAMSTATVSQRSLISTCSTSWGTNDDNRRRISRSISFYEVKIGFNKVNDPLKLVPVIEPYDENSPRRKIRTTAIQ